MINLTGVDPRMIANNLTPYEPTHPGEVLKEEIEYRGISQRTLAKQMGISYTLLNEILNCKRPVLTEYALLFEAALGIEAEMLIKMQARFNLYTTKRNSKFIEKLNEVRKFAAL